MSRMHARARPSRVRSLSARIFLGFSLVLFAFVVVALVSLASHVQTRATLRLLHEGYLPLALTLSEARASQDVFVGFLDRLPYENEPKATQDWLTAARRVRPVTLRRVVARIRDAERLNPPADERATLARLRLELRAVETQYQSAEGYYARVYRTEANYSHQNTADFEQLRRVEADAADHLRRAWDRMQRQVAAASNQALYAERRFMGLLGSCVLLALIVGFVVLLWVRKLLSPLPKLRARLLALGRGDMQGRIEIDSDDELGELAVELERMADAIGARDARLRDAAETQRMFQRMQELILASLRDAVLVVDEKNIIRSANPPSEAMFEIASVHIGARIEETNAIKRVPMLPEWIDAVRKSAEPLRRTLSVADQQLEISISPFGLDASNGGGVLVVAEDVTDEVNAKTKLIHTERLAAIGRMAAHIAHEVRNPLSSLGLNVDLLVEEFTGGDNGGPLRGAHGKTDVQAIVQAVRSEIERLRHITDEYLGVVRLPSPQISPEDLGEVVKSVVEFMTPEMQAASVTIDVRVEPKLPWVHVDEPQTRQALLNVLRNAKEAMSEGGNVVVEVLRDRQGVAVRVRDEGIGLSAEQKARMFELFYTTKERGTGLGLALTHQIIEAHGGQIRVIDSPGKGTIVELWFPEAAPPHLQVFDALFAAHDPMS